MGDVYSGDGSLTQTCWPAAWACIASWRTGIEIGRHLPFMSYAVRVASCIPHNSIWIQNKQGAIDAFETQQHIFEITSYMLIGHDSIDYDSSQNWPQMGLKQPIHRCEATQFVKIMSTCFLVVLPMWKLCTRGNENSEEHDQRQVLEKQSDFKVFCRTWRCGKKI